MSETRTIEYRVRAVTRYIVTRYVSGHVEYHANGTASGSSGSSSVVGEFDSQTLADLVVEAMTKSDACMHASDCATHNMPAMPNGPCDCGAATLPA